MIRLLLAACAGVLVGLFEVAVSSFLPAWAEMMPLIPIVALLIVSSSRSRAYVSAIAGGLIIEAYQVASPDLPMFRLLVITLLMDVAARQFLTNRSVYATAALAVFGRLIAWLLSLLISGFAVVTGFSDTVWDPMAFPLVPMGWDIILTSLGFLSIALFTGRFVGFGSRRRAGSIL